MKLAITALLLTLAAPVFAQLKTGSVSGTIKDSQGTPLPGATVTLSGRDMPQVTVTDPQGAFQFLGLWPDSYTVRVSLDGFDSVERNLVIQGGSTTEVAIELEQIWDCFLPTVYLPMLDFHQTSVGWTVSTEELRHLPISHDPWAVLRLVPGVLIDR